MEDLHAKITCESRPSTGPNGEDAEYTYEGEGTINGLLNAYVQLTKELVSQIAEETSEALAMNLFAQALEQALKEIGYMEDDEE